MKLLLVLDSLAPGGTETSTVATIPALRGMGVVVGIALLNDVPSDLTSQAVEFGSSVQVLTGNRMTQVKQLRRIIRRQRIDLVHTALFSADQLGRIASVGIDVPVISSFVNTPYDSSRLADRNISRWRLRMVQTLDAITGHLLVDRFHAVSEGVKESNARALALRRERITVAERGRDAAHLGVFSTNRREAVRERLGVDTGAKVILNLGRLDHQKGQVLLVGAAASMCNTRRELVWLIAGKDGSASSDVVNAMENTRSASPDVRLLGHRADVGDLLCAADVLVISSHFEGTAGVALEAMALGLPVLSTDLVGLRGVLEHGRNAYLVPPGSADSIARGVAALLDDAALRERLGRQGQLDFQQRFTVQAASERMMRLYDSMLRVPNAERTVEQCPEIP